MMDQNIQKVRNEIVSCSKCARLVEFRTKIAEQKRKLEEEKAKLEKEIAEQKRKLEEEKLYNDLEPKFRKKCQKKLLNDLYEIGTPEYRTCILNKGSEKQKQEIINN